MDWLGKNASDRAMGVFIILIASTLPIAAILMFYFNSLWWLLLALPFMLLLGG
jgi:hypothetical protein